jgi:hypothetical protein
VRLYADRADRRTLQLAADLGLVVWGVVWVLVARTVHGAVLVLARPGESLTDLGRSVADTMGSAADAASDVPVLGDELATPFGALADAGGAVGGAGGDVRDAATTLAFWLAAALVVLPVGWLLLRWLAWRLRWVRESTGADRLCGGAGDLELLAARAVATAPLPELASLPPGTGAAWRAGDPVATRLLAGLELRRLGLRPPAGT